MPVIKIDFHTHPLGHYEWLIPPQVRMALFVERAILKGLDAIVATDHDKHSGEWMKEYIWRKNRPLLVISGEEVTFSVPDTDKTNEHLICVNTPHDVPALPYSEIIDWVHEKGGATIAAHPIEPGIVINNKDKLDAYERFNGGVPGYDFTIAEVKLPVVSDTDSHTPNELFYMPNYTVLDVDELTAEGIVAAVRAGKIVELMR